MFFISNLQIVDGLAVHDVFFLVWGLARHEISLLGLYQTFWDPSRAQYHE